MRKREIIKKIMQKKEFSELPREDVEMAFSKFERRQTSEEDKVKLTRNLLLQVFSAFTSRKLLSLRDRSAEWILKKHLSTRERIPYYEEIYERILKGLEKEISIIDLGAGIRKEDMQAVIIGKTNTGKSSLLSLLTNAKPRIAEHRFTTKSPVVGMMNFNGTNVQLIEVPASESEYYDRGIVNSADTISILITNLKQIKEIEKNLGKARGKRIIVFNALNQDKEQLRKIEATLKSKKYDALIIDIKKNENLEELKNKLFQSFNKMRVYTKEPGKEKSPKPMILDPGATIETIAKKLLKNLSSLKETKLWGPSSKFPSQKVGLQHKLKDMDVIEFRTR